MNDVLTGKAGAIPALLALHACTHDAQFLDMAKQLGDQLCALAQQHEDRAHWVHPQLWPRGLGGFSHGVTGVGWALTKLARATGVIKYEEVAHAAFEFEDSLFDSDERNWLDLRNLGGPKTAAVWCHGSVGIGLAHLDLDPTAKSSRTKLIVQRAVHATSTMGMGWNHCLCHGDFSAWELLDQAIACGMGPAEMTRDGLLAQLLTSLEDHGPTCGLTREVFVPGLLPGLGGVAYQLLRAHRDSDLPSVLTPGIVGLHDNSQRPWPREQGAEKADFSIEAV